jgi:hypothetical protein
MEAKMKTRIECPGCQQPIELNIPDESASARSVRSMARGFVIISVLMGLFALGIVAVTAIDNNAAAGDPSQQSNEGYFWAAGLFTLALWLYLIGQIVHIRALLEKN